MCESIVKAEREELKELIYHFMVVRQFITVEF